MKISTGDALYQFTVCDINKLKLISKELDIQIINDLLEFYPSKYVSQLRIDNLLHINDSLLNNIIIVTGSIKNMCVVETKKSKHLEGDFYDQYGNKISLIWFNHIEENKKRFELNKTIILLCELTKFNNTYYFAHPCVLSTVPDETQLLPYYRLTERLKKRGVDNKFFRRLLYLLFQDVDIAENIPQDIIERYKLMPRYEALNNIHRPTDNNLLGLARRRLKFEELFFWQLKILQSQTNKQKVDALRCQQSELVKHFINDVLKDISLTGAQKKVIAEIFNDLSSGKQMNRLLQGDVGCGKTIVAFITMLYVIDNGAQAAIMCPTEILAEQHFLQLKQWCGKLNINIDLLTGTTSYKERNVIMKGLHDGNLQVLVGTHALLNDNLRFKQLGLVVIDEQHKFGVRQRSQVLDNNNNSLQPHILLMTATPIPRTLALTLYGGYDVSIIDEKPIGRHAIKTIHLYESQRLRVFGLIRESINKGHQVYIVFPLIDTSDRLKLKNLNDGYSEIVSYFKGIQVGILHGQMDIKTKEEELQNFVCGKTKILVSTTVVEVGIDVPNATVIVIVDADHYGLAQLHQLRGRVGRGKDASLCVLMTKDKLSDIAKMRIKAIVGNDDGFKIANIDMHIRGYGDMMGTPQSGKHKLKIADIYSDEKMLLYANMEAKKILDADPSLQVHQDLQRHMIEKNDVNFYNVG